MSVEAMKQALEALEKLPTDAWHGAEAAVRNYEAISVLRQAIEQAEKQEPVAYIEHHKGGDNLRWEEVNHEYAKATPLYTAPPQREWVGLTDEEILEILGIHPDTDEEIEDYEDVISEARAIEAKLKEKNI